MFVSRLPTYQYSDTNFLLEIVIVAKDALSFEMCKEYALQFDRLYKAHDKHDQPSSSESSDDPTSGLTSIDIGQVVIEGSSTQNAQTREIVVIGNGQGEIYPICLLQAYKL